MEGVRVGKSQGNPQLGGYSDMEEKPVWGRDRTSSLVHVEFYFLGAIEMGGGYVHRPGTQKKGKGLGEIRSSPVYWQLKPQDQ